MNNWVDVKEALPPLTQVVNGDIGFSDRVAIWMVMDGDDLGDGLVDGATYYYNSYEPEWLADEDLDGFTVTHWMAIEPPKMAGEGK